jgi:hypothetical protein
MITDPAMRAACLQVIKEVMSICTTSRSNLSAYEWESIDWLTSNLGTVEEKYHHNTWHCNENESLVAPGKGKPGGTGAESCDASGCHLCVVERVDGKIHADLLQEPPKKK